MPEQRQKFRILSLDGGGIRGLSSLIILRKIMKEIASEQIGSCGPPELCPCDYFDYITGAGMGGYMIILQYGRFKLTPKKLRKSTMPRSYCRLKLKQQKRESIFVAGSLLRLTRDIRFVYAVQKDKGPCCIHTSDVRRSVVDPRKTSTSEIFRALTAAEGLFSEYTLEGTDGSRVTFLDHPYPWGFSNPTRKAVVLIRDTLRGVSIGVQPDDLIIVNIGSGQVAEADVGDLAILGHAANLMNFASPMSVLGGLMSIAITRFAPKSTVDTIARFEAETLESLTLSWFHYYRFDIEPIPDLGPNDFRSVREVGNKTEELLKYRKHDLQRLAAAIDTPLLHLRRLNSMETVALELTSQGRYKEAQQIRQQIMELRRKLLGDEHPDTLTSMNGLSDILVCLGKFQEAEKIYQSTLELRKKVLGDEHPDTLMSMNGLADALLCLEKFQEAEKIYQSTLELRKKVLGDEHPDTLTSMNGLSDTLVCLGKFQEAEEIYRSALALRKKVLGDEHPDTLMSMNGLADALLCLEEFQEAEEMYQSALALRKKALGDEHHDTLKSLNGLANALLFLKKHQEAEDIRQSIQPLRKEMLGDEHPNTLTMLTVLAQLLYEKGMWNSELLIRRDLLELNERTMGEMHLNTTTAMRKLEDVLVKLARHGEAEGIYQRRRSIERRRKSLY
ncbi:Amidase [Fusarium oxysporum f. sp. albedinis]|nr:Amidase [Fusarium oxysporum f. sp. albedinis]